MSEDKKITIAKLVALIKTRGGSCKTEVGGPCCDFCSDELYEYCMVHKEEHRYCQAKYELDQIPQEEIFEALI